MSCPIGSGKTWEIGLGSGTDEAEVTVCCPIAFKQIGQVDFLPEGGSDEGKEAGKAVIPLTEERLVLEEDIREEGGPDLPSHGVGVVAKEASELKSLFDLLEESFDLPAASIKVSDRGWAPFEMVGEEDHGLFLSVDFHHGFDATKDFRILFEGRGSGQAHRLVAQDFGVGRDLEAMLNLVPHVFLGTSHPKNTPRREITKMRKVDVSFIENDDFTLGNGRAEFPSAFGIIFFGRIHNGKTWKQALEIQAHVALGCCLAASMLCPVHAVSNELDGCRVHDVDDASKPTCQATTPSTVTKIR